MVALSLRRAPALLRGLLLSLALVLVGRAAWGEPPELFRIERSTNRNYLRFDARQLGNGELHADSPVDAYWIMAAEDGRREGMTWLERQLAYGYSAERVGSAYRLRLAAFDRRAVMLRKAGARWRAEVTIGGHRCALRRLWVQADGNSVRWLELHGFDVRTGEARTERLVND